MQIVLSTACSPLAKCSKTRLLAQSLLLIVTNCKSKRNWALERSSRPIERVEGACELLERNEKAVVPAMEKGRADDTALMNLKLEANLFMHFTRRSVI